MKALKTIKEKVGNLLKRTSNFLFDDPKPIYAVCITSILFLGLGLKYQADYALNILKFEKEAIMLEVALNEQGRVIKEQGEFIDFMGVVNSELRQQNSKQDVSLMRASEAIDSLATELNYQKSVVQKLVEYLKSKGDWPPKVAPPARPKPIDPDKII